MMKLFDFSFPSPAENLACDEALLDWCEENGGDEILRFWESPDYFVVVGYANKIATEVNATVCEVKKIPILRRCSGGGTVLQGHGCLNYALILRIDENSPLVGISSANRFIMERNRLAIEDSLFGRAHHSVRATTGKNTRGAHGVTRPAISIRGHTDLAIGELKFSGNSQRRHKKFLLFHGTFLLDFDLSLITECLCMPSKQPDYRDNRNHLDFLTNLDMSASEIKCALKKIWNTALPLENPPLMNISKLAREKYATAEWNRKF